MTERAEQITADDLEKLRHMLGVSYGRTKAYRNHYCAGVDAVAGMERLAAAGFVERGEVSGAFPTYYATLEGARAVGVKELPR